ncbi:MAG: 3-phosphoshikimate 1-carboxyvinyltransferase [Oscillospiraceae bacterium]
MCTIDIPPSKSLTHRAIICAALGGGKVKNVILSDDIIATINAVKALGAECYINGDTITIKKIVNVNKKVIIDCNQSGTTLRLMMPICSSLCNEVYFTGDKSLFNRPLDYENFQFTFEKDNFIKVTTKLTSKKYCVKGNISSQFISGMLLASPVFKGEVEIVPPVCSKSYIDLTYDIIDKFTDNKGDYKYSEIEIEGDFSQLAFFAVYASLYGKVRLNNANHNSKQGDKIILDILKNMGAIVNPIENGYIITKNKLNSIDISVDNCPDLFPVLTVLLVNCGGILRNVHRLHQKESDRVNAMITELSKLGATIYEKDDCVIAQKSVLTSTDLYCHNDHRVAMALSVACPNANLIGKDCVKKSYPNFFEDFKKISHFYP